VKIGGFGIGFTVAFDILAAGPITGVDESRALVRPPARAG
jgi:hypothetical protein